MHFFPTKGGSAGRNCFVDYHDEGFYGLAISDCNLVNKRKSEWVEPTQTRRKTNLRHIKGLRQQSNDEDSD